MFKIEFAGPVAIGTKRQTIRPWPKHMPKVGQCESWRQWSDRPYRSKQIELAKVRLTKVRKIALHPKCAQREAEALVNGYRLMPDELTALARADGFSSWEKLVSWFEQEHGLPFFGIVINAETI